LVPHNPTASPIVASGTHNGFGQLIRSRRFECVGVVNAYDDHDEFS
jgi:hypothetical protein